MSSPHDQKTEKILKWISQTGIIFVTILIIKLPLDMNIIYNYNTPHSCIKGISRYLEFNLRLKVSLGILSFMVMGQG